MRKKTFAAAALLAAATLTLTACGNGDDDASPVTVVSEEPGSDKAAIVLDKPFEKPDLVLTDTNGKKYDLRKETQGKPTLIYFGYTHCPDICQIVMSTIAGAVTRLDDARKKDVQVVFVTTDPARDTGPVLREYLDRFNPAFVGVTGRLSRIIALGKPLGVYVDKGQKLPSGGYEVDHSTHVYGVVGDKARVAWQQGTSPAHLAADIIRLLKS